MKFKIKSGNPETQRSACVVVSVFQNRRMSASAKRLDDACSGIIAQILDHRDMIGDSGETLMLYNLPNTCCDRVLLVGCGDKQEFGDSAYRKATRAAAKHLQNSGATQAKSFLIDLPLKDRDLAWKVRQAVISTEDALYSFEQTKSAKKKPHPALEKLTLMLSNRDQSLNAKRALIEGKAIADGISLTRELGNLPGNICTPTYLAEQAKAIKKGRTTLEIDIMDETEMQKQGMGALLSVSRGSEQSAKLITIKYHGATKETKPIVLVGKGITFDTGGISIKPSEAMDEMKFDMCGAGSVLGTILACAQMELTLNIVGIIASAENMPGGRASKPGDIITTLSGKTVEILNTDAEGRLVLCDALTYAERFKPAAVIDIATLTGACIIALGHHPSGLMSNHEPLTKELLKAGQTSGDRAWQLPLWEDYQEQLESNFADMANIGGRPAGSITAACFLSRFTKNYHWAHLDIAGTAWQSGKEKGATGRPVNLLTHFLMDRVNAK